MPLRLFIWIFLVWLGPLPGQVAHASLSTDSLLVLAERSWAVEDFAAAANFYTELYELGYQSEQSLYRLAYAHEQLGQVPQTIFYLRRLQWEFGGDNIEAKIQALLSEGQSFTTEDAPSYEWVQWTYQRRWPILIGLGIVAVLALLLGLLFRQAVIRGIGLTMATLALTTGLTVGLLWTVLPPTGVMLMHTKLYTAPSYGANHEPMTLPPGTTVQLLQKQDIWQQIRARGTTAWVPTFMIEPIHRW